MMMYADLISSFDSVYGPLAVPVFVCDDQAIVQNVNAPFCDLAGGEKHEFVDRPVYGCFEQLAGFFQKGRFRNVLPEYSPTQLTRCDGERLPVRVHYIRISDDDGGGMAGVLGLVADLRDLEQAKMALHALTLENEA